MPQWCSRYTRTQVISIRKESDDVFTLALKPGRRWNRGQSFQAGQFVALWTQRNGTYLSRYFSISSSPHYFAQTRLIELTIQKQTNGLMTPWLEQALSSGDFIGLSDPQGDFILQDASKPVVLIAAGSGITPFRSMLNELKNNAPHSDVHLVYFASGRHLFEKEWLEFAHVSASIRIHLIDTSTQKRIHSDQLLKFCPDIQRSEIYLCGPHGFINTSRQALSTLKVPETAIHVEHFGPASIQPTNTSSHSFTDTKIVFRRSGLNADGKDDTSLLELAEEQGLQPSYGCRMGVCHQCKCTKRSGVVRNVITGQLSDTGEEDIQLCVSIPHGNVELDL